MFQVESEYLKPKEFKKWTVFLMKELFKKE